MDATVELAARHIRIERKPDGWLTRLFDYKPFLVFLCLLPTIGLLVVFLTYPLGLGIWLSMTDTTIGQPGEFIGLDNFIDLMDDPVFWMSVTNTIFYTVVATAGKFALGLWLALLLNHHIPFKAFIRAIVLLPWIVPTVLSAIAWWWIYSPQFSIVSFIIVDVLHLRDTYINFLGTPWPARWSLIVANIWRGIPFVAITLLAGLQTISPSLYEAALLDGAIRLAEVPPHHRAAADADPRGGADAVGAVHLLRLPAGLRDHPRRPVQHHAPDGDAGIPARYPRRAAWRGRGDRSVHDPVPDRRDAAVLLRCRTAQVAAGRSQ